MTGEELATILAGDPARYPAWARFDAAFYRAANPEIGIAGSDAPDSALLRHYLQVGRFQGLSPNPWFDETWYLARHPEIAALVAGGRPTAGGGTIESGFEHYLLLGHAALSPHWLYDEALYREQVTEHAVAATGDANFYDHYLRSGARRGLAAHPLFDPAFYLAANAVPDAALPAEGPFGHYLARLWRDRVEGWTAPEFDLAGTRREPACAAAVAEGRAWGALHHALATGPVRVFSPALAEAQRRISAATAETRGAIDIIGAHEGAGGWFLAGWLGRPASVPEGPIVPPGATVLAGLRHAAGTHVALAEIALFRRDDLAGRGEAFIAFVPAAEGLAMGEPESVDILTETVCWRLGLPRAEQPTAASALLEALRPIADRLAASPVAASLRRRLAHPLPDGANTLPQLPERVFFEVDEAIHVPGGDLVLAGWHLAPPGAVRAIHLRRGWLTRPIHLDQAIVIERPDVRDTVGQETGLLNLRCGFMLRLPRVWREGEAADPPPYIEVEMTSGAIAHRGLAIGSRSGMPAIRFMLDRTAPAFGDAAAPYERVTGPAIAALQARRMARAEAPHRQDFGTPPADPRVSVVVTLYGRVDFLDFQLGIEAAQHTRHPGTLPAIERLYVLDDPPRARATEALAVQAHLRFALPFSLLSLPENRGFAGANNAGLRAARGRYVCFLNSDVFAGTPDWVARLADRLDADPTLGAVAPRLLYEDGSIQHDGMAFRRIPRIGAWRFPDHPGKGMRPDGATGLLRVAAATGACLMLRRDLALALGGFDEAYPIGDFEDADLCMKLHGMGLAIAVDRDVTLYHLERQSQAGSAEHWRMQLTLFNAWQHERRWHRLLDRVQPAAEAAP